MYKNISELIQLQAKKNPKKKSIVFSVKSVFGYYKYPSYTFSELDKRINKFCNKLKELGVSPGNRVLFFVKPNLDFAVITFALFRMGAVPVFIDPGMKRKTLFKTIKDVSPDVLIGIPKIHYLRRFFSEPFESVKLYITTGMFSGPSAKSLYWGLKKQSPEFCVFIPGPSDLCAILYTSGGTGDPKGVEYTHDIFINQTKMLKEEFNLTDKDCDIPGFPLFSFFTLAMGMTSCIPDLDFSGPSMCEPKKLYRNIVDSKASFIAGSPAIWEKLADYCLLHNLVLSNVKYVVMFGAPVSMSIHKKFEKILPIGTTYTPYGATECLPISNISGNYILKNLQKSSSVGRGTCVGRPLKNVEVRIIRETKEVIRNIGDCEFLKTNEVGEIIVKSLNTTKSYFNDPESTEGAKIMDKKGLWHRMGDVGHFDEKGQLWFAGRKKHVVCIGEKRFYPLPIELVYNQHSKIKRSALVKDVKNNRLAIIIERYDQKESIETMFLMDLKNLSQTHVHTKEVHHFYAKYPFPVDIRHNIKIDRTKLQSEVFDGK